MDFCPSRRSHDNTPTIHYPELLQIMGIVGESSGKNVDHQSHALNGQFWSTKGLGQGSSISCQLLLSQHNT